MKTIHLSICRISGLHFVMICRNSRTVRRNAFDHSSFFYKFYKYDCSNHRVDDYAQRKAAIASIAVMHVTQNNVNDFIEHLFS